MNTGAMFYYRKIVIFFSHQNKLDIEKMYIKRFVSIPSEQNNRNMSRVQLFKKIMQ